MIGNYLKVASRNILKRKLYSFINAFGLSIAIAFSILIYLFIQDEKSFDQFHDDKERILVMTEKGFSRDKFEKGEKEPYGSSAYLPAKLAEVMMDEIPEVACATRFANGEGIMRYNEKIFMQPTHFVDSGFFKTFSFQIVKGSVNQIFRGKDAVLTSKLAERFFGDQDPVGKTFSYEINGTPTDYTVAAVIETPPANSSIDFEMLLPIASRPYFARNRDQWGAFSYPTFVKLHRNATLDNFRSHLASITEKYMGEKKKQWRERENIPNEFIVFDFNFISLSDLHLNTELGWDRSSDPKYSYILACIAGLILVIAAINYVSLALTTSASRRVEVGIRKVVGAYKSQLVYQFGFESIILSFISMFFGIGLVLLFLPAFNTFTGKGIVLSSINVAQLFGFAVLISLVIGFVAGAYPSLFLSGFKPVAVLKGRFTSKLQAAFTKPLVVIQFALSAFLIISSIIMFRQMKFITSKDLGYDKDQLVVIQTHAGWNDESDKAIERLRTKLRSVAGVTGVTGTSSSFNRGWSRYGYKIKDENKSAYVYRVDPYYIDLLGIELNEGRNFDESIASDSTAVIVNEALVRDMGWKNPLEEHLNWNEDTVGLGSKVIGVVKDYHFLSLENAIEPMFLSLDKKNVGHMVEAMVKLEAGDIPEKIEKLKTAWGELYPDKPFDYSFVDENVGKQYEKYNRWMSIAGLSTVFAILIACLGLFGLAGINAINRTKEIGIRKVMGAELVNIFVLLNKQFVWMAIIAFAIATPFSWYVMNKWLSSFQFKIEMGWELFFVSALVGLITALLTVSYHGIKAALINPAETLKYE